MASHLRHRGDLGQGEDEPVRAARRPRPGCETKRSRVRRPAGAGGGLEALEPDPDERRRGAGGDGGGHGGCGGDGVGVLGVVAPVPVAVLEVQPEVLDRLACRASPGTRGATAAASSGSWPSSAHELFEPAVGVGGGQRLGAPVRGEAPGVKRSAGT